MIVWEYVYVSSFRIDQSGRGTVCNAVRGKCSLGTVCARFLRIVSYDNKEMRDMLHMTDWLAEFNEWDDRHQNSAENKSQRIAIKTMKRSQIAIQM